jgi:hypothetical protein
VVVVLHHQSQVLLFVALAAVVAVRTLEDLGIQQQLAVAQMADSITHLLMAPLQQLIQAVAVVVEVVGQEQSAQMVVTEALVLLSSVTLARNEALAELLLVRVVTQSTHSHHLAHT